MKKQRSREGNEKTKAENQKGRNKERGRTIGSLNIKSTLNSETSDGGHRMCTNSFEFRSIPASESNVITSF